MAEKLTMSNKTPQISLARSTKSRMRITAACAFAAICQSALSDGGHSLFVALAALAAALLVEGLLWFVGLTLKGESLSPAAARKMPILDGSAAVTALVLTLLLPHTINPALAAGGAVFAIVVVKHCFGGLGANWLNPALGGWLFMRASWPHAFVLPPRSDTPLIAPFDAPVTDFVNRFFLKPLGAQMSEGYISLFNAHGAGIIADRAVLLLVLGSIVLIVTRSLRAEGSVVFLAVYLFLVHFSGVIFGDFAQSDMLFVLFSEGTLVAAFFLLGDTVTGAKNLPLRGAIAALAALLAWYFRLFLHEPYGAVTALLCVNALTPLLRRAECRPYREPLVMDVIPGGSNG